MAFQQIILINIFTTFSHCDSPSGTDETYL